MKRKSSTLANSEAHDVDNNTDSKRKKRKGKETQSITQDKALKTAPIKENVNNEPKKKRKTGSVSIDPVLAESPSPNETTKRKKKKDLKAKQQVVGDELPVDPALSMDVNTENSNVFVSALLTAAAQQGQAMNQSGNAPNFQGSNFGPNFNLSGPDPSISLEGLDVASNEELVRAIQGLDVGKLADALRALGDAGSAANFLNPAQLAQGQANVNGVVLGQASQLPAPSAMILSHSPVALPPVGPNTFLPPPSDEHAHMLANKWLSTSKLAQLTKSIGLTYKKGKFSTLEENAIKQAIESHRMRNGLTEEQLNEIIFAKSKGKDNSFWFEITSHVPHRPVIAVYHYVRRAFHPMKAQGKWMPSEDDLLRRAVTELGQSWEKVSQRVGRMASDCRDRWRNHINHSEGRVFGMWTYEEERRLTEIVTELTTAQGKSSDHDVFWTQVAARMGTRGRHQCRIKWTDSLSKTVKNDGQTPRWSPQDAYILVHKIASLNVRDDSEIDWKLLPDENWNLWSTHALQRRWLTLKRSVRGYEEMSHQEIMDILRVKKAQPPPMPQPVRSRVVSAPMVPMDAQAADVAIPDSFSTGPVAGPSGFGNMGVSSFNNAPIPDPGPSVYYGTSNVVLPMDKQGHEETNNTENGDDSDKDTSAEESAEVQAVVENVSVEDDNNSVPVHVVEDSSDESESESSASDSDSDSSDTD